MMYFLAIPKGCDDTTQLLNYKGTRSERDTQRNQQQSNLQSCP